MNKKGIIILSTAIMATAVGTIALVQPDLVSSTDSYKAISYVNGSNPLILAVQNGDIDAVTKCLKKDPASVNAVDKQNNCTALHYAILYGHTAIAKFLIRNGVDVDAQNNYDQTALHYAALFGNTAIAECLIDNGAYIDAVDVNSQTALIRAIWCNNAEMAKQL